MKNEKKKKKTLQGKLCAFDKSPGNVILLYGSTVSFYHGCLAQSKQEKTVSHLLLSHDRKKWKVLCKRSEK